MSYPILALFSATAVRVLWYLSMSLLGVSGGHAWVILGTGYAICAAALLVIFLFIVFDPKFGGESKKKTLGLFLFMTLFVPASYVLTAGFVHIWNLLS